MLSRSNGTKIAANEGLKYYQTIEELLEKEEIDLIDICVPTWLHEPLVLMAAKYKKHIICEKPVALSLESYDRMIEACEKNQVKFMVAQVIRFWPEYEKIHELYQKNELGSLDYICAKRLSEFPKWSKWHHIPEKSGGALFDLALHDIDYIQYLCGDFKLLYAAGRKSETGCWDHVNATIEFFTGTIAVIEGTYNLFGGFPFTMSLRAEGREGIADFIQCAGHNLDNIQNSNRQLYLYQKSKIPEKLCIDEFDAYTKEIEYFADTIIYDKANTKVSNASSRKTLELIMAIKESLETGNIIHAKCN